MKKSIFVISDLHLGGAPARDGKPSFQMCSPVGQARLAEFVRYVADQRSAGREIHLVLNGDIVDFLAEKEFSSFTIDDEAARQKLDHIFANTKDFWDTVASYVETGSRLTLLLGNHDAELSLPLTRRLLLERIGRGQITFLYDNEAFVEGPVLIEHGNRYDGWNVISHDALREIRSALSRREKPILYNGPAGSQVVFKIMNRLKAKYPFVDLLKPETAAVFPLLAVLDPSVARDIPKFAVLAEKEARVKFDSNGIPVDVANIAAPVHASKRDKQLIALADELAGTGDLADISTTTKVRDLLTRLRDAVTGSAKTAVREAATHLLYKAFRAFADVHRQTFDVGHEDEDYLKPAKAAAQRGFQVIVFGHTHTVKRIPLNEKGARYLNCGTWADLIKVPEAILTGNEAEAREQLSIFMDDMEHNNLTEWRVQIPTFARIDLDSDRVIACDVYFFDGPTAITPVPNGRITRFEHANASTRSGTG